jgi:CheY-like chemotaxis protein
LARGRAHNFAHDKSTAKEGIMGTTVYVRVVGFLDTERHALNTLFRLSHERETSYVLWTPDILVAPHLALIDVESYESGMALASPGLNRNLRLICVGEGAPPSAWRVFSRPLNWPAVVHAMDALFTSASGLDIDMDLDGDSSATAPLGIKATLVMDASLDERRYLRARLALAGLVEVDEATTPAQALQLAKNRRYDLVLFNLDTPSPDGWIFIDRLVALEPAIGGVVLTTTDIAWHVQERAEQAGCRGVLHKPFDPLKISRMLQKV